MHFKAAIISKDKDNEICFDALRNKGEKKFILRCITIGEEFFSVPSHLCVLSVGLVGVSAAERNVPVDDISEARSARTPRTSLVAGLAWGVGGEGEQAVIHLRVFPSRWLSHARSLTGTCDFWPY